jgi:hypothetical protein
MTVPMANQMRQRRTFTRPPARTGQCCALRMTARTVQLWRGQRGASTIHRLLKRGPDQTSVVGVVRVDGAASYDRDG